MTPKKKTSVRKRTPFPREVLYTTSGFVKDWEKLTQSGKHDMHLVKEAISLLMMNDGALSAEWRDHKLAGEWEGFRECHVKGDLLLVYQVHEKSYCEVIVCHRLGTHSELF